MTRSAKSNILSSPLIIAFFTLFLSCGINGPTPRAPDICPCTGTGCVAPPPAKRFGLYDERLTNNYSARLDTITALLGTAPAFVSWYLQIDDSFPSAMVSTNAARSIRTEIAMNLRSLSLDNVRNDTLLSEIAAGLWDTTLTLFATRAAASGDTIFLRFGYEMNGDWFPWCGKPLQFVAAWRHAHALFNAAGARNVRWVFCPNILYGAETFEDDIAPYYPGDSVVDIVGVDGYNYGDAYDQWHSWENFGNVVEPTLEQCKTFGKPLWVAETACPSDPRRRAWIEDMTAYLDRNPCIEAVLWFNAHKPAEPDFRLESDSASLAAIRTWLGR